jgi:hypothetical protein
VLSKNDMFTVEMLSLLVGGILMSVSSLADRVGRDFSAFVHVESVAMYLNYMYYAWRNWPRS